MRNYGRAPSENNSSGKCGQKADRCVKLKKKECKLKKGNCPHYKLENCKQAKESNWPPNSICIGLEIVPSVRGIFLY